MAMSFLCLVMRSFKDHFVIIFCDDDFEQEADCCQTEANTQKSKCAFVIAKF